MFNFLSICEYFYTTVIKLKYVGGTVTRFRRLPLIFLVRTNDKRELKDIFT